MPSPDGPGGHVDGRIRGRDGPCDPPEPAHRRSRASAICVPANFTERTGRDHWEVLLRARAIENGAYVLAPAQCGRPPSGPAAYGHSMVVDPWGIVVAQASDGPGLVFAELDPRRIAGARERLPMLAHRRPEAYRLDGA